MTHAARAGTDAPPAFDALREAHGFGRPLFGRVILWQAARTAMRLAASACIALLIGRLIMDAQTPSDAQAPSWAFAAVPAMLIMAALAGLMADHAQARAETEVAARLRGAAKVVLQAMPPRLLSALPAGALTVGLQRHPEAVAAVAIGHRAARAMMAIGPSMAVAALGLASWQAALTILVLTPVMIVFFVLVGDAIRRRAEAQEAAFARLAGQFADRIRALPTILANDALAAEGAKLADRLRAHARNTMRVLRIAFLNAGIIDFFASLSIAVLALFLGLGHLKLATVPGFSGLALWQSLFILMIAPDYFAPFRRYAEQYHAKAEGLAGAAGLDRLLNAEAPRPPDIAFPQDHMVLPSHGLVTISGPSGSGKSTLLRRLAGLEETAAATSLPAGGIAWIATDSHVPMGTLREAIAWNTPGTCHTRLMLAAADVGLIDDELLPGGLDARIEAGGVNLSGGQRLRVALARALLGARTVIADEPTAKLDGRTAAMVRFLLRRMAQKRLVVVATHDHELVALADRAIRLPSGPWTKAAA